MRALLRSLVALVALAAPVRAQGLAPDPASNVRFDQRLGELLPREAAVTDEEGRARLLGDFFHERPVVFLLVYRRCPMLCDLVLGGLVSALKTLPFEAGRDFEVVALSIDPRQTPAESREQERGVLDRYGREEGGAGWHFLVASEDVIHRAADAAGFRYVYDAVSDQYAHAAGIVVATPEGRLSRYFLGVEYSPRDLRLALVEASEGRIGGLVEQVLLLCLHYDPATGKYGFVIQGALRAGGVATVLVLAFFVVRALARERRRAQESAP